MASREIVTLWATRRSIDAGYHPPELIEAWDAFSIEENQEGWFAACESGLAAMGDDLDQYRYITLQVAESAIDESFFATVSADATAHETPEAGPRV